jgi:hypothetical protein
VKLLPEPTPSTPSLWLFSTARWAHAASSSTVIDSAVGCLPLRHPVLFDKFGQSTRDLFHRDPHALLREPPACEIPSSVSCASGCGSRYSKILTNTCAGD